MLPVDIALSELPVKRNKVSPYILIFISLLSHLEVSLKSRSLLEDKPGQEAAIQNHT